MSEKKSVKKETKKAVKKETKKATKKTKKVNNWSKEVTVFSDALQLDKSLFTWDDPKKIAKSLAKSAEESLVRKVPPFNSAMSMLVFYINRAGKKLSAERKKILEQAKIELRKLYGRDKN